MQVRILIGCAMCMLVFSLIRGTNSHGQNRLAIPSEKDPLVQILPLLKNAERCNRVVNIELTNTTKQPLTYLEYDVLRPNYLPIGLMSFLLSRDGRVIPPRETPEGPQLTRKQVRVLQPGTSIVSELDIAEMYGELPDGRYLLHVDYKISPDSHVVRDLGLTPVEIDQDLLWVEIE